MGKGSALGAAGTALAGPYGAAVGLGGAAYDIFGGSDHDPFTFKDSPQKWDPLTGYERFSEAANLAEYRGNESLARKLRSRVTNIQGRNPGVDFTGVDIQQFSPEDWQTFAGGGASEAVKGLRKFRSGNLRSRIEAQARQSGNSGLPDLDQQMNRFDVGQQKQLEMDAKSALINEMDPSLKASQMKADELRDQALFDAGEEQALRSKIAAQVRTAESNKLARTGAALGIANIQNSPAGAALAQSAADEADQLLVSSLRDTSLQVGEANQQAQAKNIELATRIAQARWNILNGDSKSLIGMRGDVASMIDAMYSRNQAMDLMEKAYEDANQQSTADRISQWSGIGANALSMYTGFGGGFGGGASPVPTTGGGSPTSARPVNPYYDPYSASQGGYSA